MSNHGGQLMLATCPPGTLQGAKGQTCLYTKFAFAQMHIPGRCSVLRGGEQKEEAPEACWRLETSEGDGRPGRSQPRGESARLSRRSQNPWSRPQTRHSPSELRA